MYDQFMELFSDADLIAVGVEGQVPQMRYSRNAKYILKLAELLGVLKVAVLKSGKELHEHQISDIKKYATGNGRATKEMMIKMLPEVPANLIRGLGAKKIDDLSDAYWIARMTQDKYEEEG